MNRHGPTVLARLHTAPGSDLALAVVTPGGGWSRRELLDRVEAGAAVLADELGSALIGVCLPEGADLAMAVLAAMGAGGAAPVRADLPPDAIAAHFTRTRVAAVVATVDSPAAMVANDLGLTVVSPHRDDGFRLRRPDRPSAHGPQDDIADLALVLTTSGTTGEPKVVPLRHGNLVSSIERIVGSLGLAADDRSLTVMPLTHIHGMVAGLLAPLAAGGAVFLGGRFDPATLPDTAASFGATFVTAVPTIHRALTASPRDNSAWTERLRLVRSSSSALPASVAESLERRFGVPVLEAYGMTEAAHQITSNTVDDLRRGTVGRADGARIRVIDDEGRTLEPGGVGDVVIRGRNVMGGYIADAVVNDAAFVDGWFRTGDLGRIDPDGHLVLVGRTREMINRGGETIAPGPIEEVLRSLDGVDDAVVFAAPHPTLGEQVAAAVVTENASIPVVRLQQEVALRRGDAEVPRVVHLVEAIPVGPTGKVQRNRLAESFGSSAPARSRVPFDSVESEVADAWRSVGLAPMARSDDFIALGGDSLAAMAVAFDLGQRWGFEVRLVDLLRDTSLSGMASLRVGPPRRRRDRMQSVTAPAAAQRRMLAADRLGIDPAASHMAFAWSIRGEIDAGRLRRAVETVIEHHPALRASFVFAPTLDYVPLNVDEAYEWIDDDAVLDVDQARTEFEAAAARSYDLVEGPLIRFALWPLGSTDRWFLGFAYHHAVLDGRSRRVVLDDLARAFAGESWQVPAPRVRSRHRPMSETDRAWWADRFRDVPVELDWPTRVPATAGLAGARPAVERIELGESTVERLRQVCAAHHVTPTMVQVAASALGLQRLTGDNKVAVGLAVDHRSSSCDGSVGVTMDSVPVVVDLAASRSTADLLASVRQECLDVYERSDSGLDEIRHAAGRRYGEPILHARVQVRTDTDRLELGRLTVESLSLDPPVARAPVSLDLHLGGSSASLEIVFDPRLVERSVAASYARSFAAIVESLVDAPDCLLEEIGWVSSIDLALVDEWCRGPQGVPGFTTVDDWFRTCVAKWPRRTAVRSFDHDLTFVDLDALVGRVAIALAGRTTEGETIGSVLPGGLEQIVLQLAAWRIGRAVVAVGCDGSERRMATQLTAASVRLVVADVGGAPMPSGHQEVSFDELLTASPPGQLPDSIDPESPAWGCLTSGSTGEPRLSMGTQSNLVHLVHAWHQIVPPDAVGVATVSKPASVVGFLSEWLAPLLSGSALYFLDGVTVRDPFRIALRLNELAVTWYRGTPAMLHAVAGQVLGHVGPNRQVRLVVSGADRLTRGTADAVAEAFPDATIVNQYGCTEATSESTLGPVPQGTRDPDIGRPLANVGLEVIDANGCAVPPGVRGEIVIHGPLVTPSEAGDRGHRSGDLGWWDGAGRLHFVGRRDSRLSVNGNRIDAGEIEHALVSTGLVRSALVMIDPEAPLGASLAALVTPIGHPSAADMRSAVAELLPSFAVLNRIEVVEAIPVLDSGKIDHMTARTLLARSQDTAEVVSLSPDVADICAVVASVLGRSPTTIDPTRSLQANGGDSFAAISLQEQLFDIRGVRLDMAMLVGDRPLAELAADGVASLGGPLPGRLRRICTGHDGRRVIWFPGGGSLDVEVRRLVHHLAAPPEVLVYPYPGSEIGERPNLVLRRLVARIVETLVSLDGPPPVIAGNSFGGVVAVEVVRRLHRRLPGWVEGLLIVDAAPVEQRRRARAASSGRRSLADLRGVVTDRDRDVRDPAVRWRRNTRASRIMLDTHRRSGTVVGVPAVVVATAERRRATGRSDLGWSDHLGENVEVIELPGDHGGLLVEPKVAVTARAVTDALQRLERADS